MKKDIPPATRREIFAWAGFDFANSSFVTIMVTVIFPVYFVHTLCAGRDDGDRLWGLAGSLSNFLVVLFSPLCGALADQRGAKKKFLFATWLGCVLATALLGWLPPGQALPALTLFVLANFCFALGENFCAGFLPEISTPATAGRISALGWSIGYFGGLSILLIVQKLSPQNGILATALFFFLAALPTFLFLRERKAPEPWPSGNLLSVSFQPILQTLRELPQHRDLTVFFICFFFASAGLNTVIYFAGIFATRELNMDAGQLALMFIFLQISAAAGAFGFGRWQDRAGSRVAIGASLVLWIGVVLGCYFSRTIPVFYVFATLAGVGIGATQSCMRAMVSQLCPPEKAGEIFGFWGLFGKLAPVIALAIFGEISTRCGIRQALLGTLAFFVLALLTLLKVPPPAIAQTSA